MICDTYPVSACMLATMQKTAGSIFVEPLDVLRRTNAKDSTGRVVPTWAVVLSTFCNISPVTAEGESEVEDRLQSVEVYDVSYPFNVTILPNDRLQVQGQLMEAINSTDLQTRSVTNVIRVKVIR